MSHSNVEDLANKLGEYNRELGEEDVVQIILSVICKKYIKNEFCIKDAIKCTYKLLVDINLYFQDDYYDFIEGEVVEVIKYSGEFYKPNFELSMEKISYDSLEKILLNMITTNKSFYKKQLSSYNASPIVNMFLDKIFKGNNMKNLTDEWNIYSVKPNFLNTTYIIDENSREEEQNERFCYFDDWGFDSCTVFYNKERLYMLLTNGMP